MTVVSLMRSFHGRRLSTISSTISPRRIASEGLSSPFLMRTPRLAECFFRAIDYRHPPPHDRSARANTSAALWSARAAAYPEKRTLTLLNPEKWEDRNDAYYIGGPLLHGCSSRWPLAPAEPFEISLHLTYTDESKSEAGRMQRGFANHFPYFDLGSNSGGPFPFP